MENKELLQEFTSLLHKNKPKRLQSKEQLDELYMLSEQEVGQTASLLQTLQEELSDSRLQTNFLVEKQQEIATSLLELKKQIITRLSHDSRDIYQQVLDINSGLLAVSEREQLALQQYCQELALKLQRAQANKGKIADLVVKLRSMDEEVDSMHEIMEKVQVMAQTRDFGCRVIRAQEEERRRVSREMHDGPAQAMANVVFLAEVCEKLIDIDSIRAKQELQELRKQVVGCLDETRKIVFDLRPMTLDDLGLIPTVKKIADMLKERTGIQSSVILGGKYDEPLDPQIEVSLFRIIQESLSNIEKHSHATEAKIIITVQDNAVIVSVEDNGDGFEVFNNDNNGDCFGLVGMGERVSLLRGELTIDSAQGQGTKIRVHIPLFQTSSIHK